MEQIEVVYVTDPPLDLDSHVWDVAAAVPIESYWAGEPAPAERHFSVNLLWSAQALHVRFQTNQNEPLIVTDHPDTSKKTIGLWDRDVCEIFIAPDRDDRNSYFEFEIAPTGEWLDLGLRVLEDKRETDWEYSSEVEAKARIEEACVVMALTIPFAGLGKTPKAGDTWLGNIFRCVGVEPDRGYLAWRPTGTPQPNFHVPSEFGEFQFIHLAVDS